MNFYSALLISLISVNFIYSFNSWADREIDAINKPLRPIPSGFVKPRNALVYSMVLLLISIVYPFFVSKTAWVLLLFLLFPFLGIVYSLKPLRFKENALLSVFSVSLILVLPVAIGYFMNSSDFGALPFFAAIFFFTASVVPLKDIEDLQGDVKYGCDNWLSRFGMQKLLLLSLGGLLADLVFTTTVRLPLFLKSFLSLLIASAAIIIAVFLFKKVNPKRLYKTIIWVVVAQAAGFVVFLIFGKPARLW